MPGPLGKGQSPSGSCPQSQQTAQAPQIDKQDESILLGANRRNHETAQDVDLADHQTSHENADQQGKQHLTSQEGQQNGNRRREQGERPVMPVNPGTLRTQQDDRQRNGQQNKRHNCAGKRSDRKLRRSRHLNQL